MRTYRAFEITGIREFAVANRVLDEPAPGQVRVGVEACGADARARFRVVPGIGG